MKINTPISAGELLDKISILKIKSKKINDKNKLENINFELNSLLDIIDEKFSENDAIDSMINDLFQVNSLLWQIEDDIREKERCNQFDKEFIELARSVYFTNDKRFSIKNKINNKLGSEFKEEKSYKKY